LGQSEPSYDAASHITTLKTTLGATTGGGGGGGSAGGVETQAFCYDDLDRLTWAGTQGTGSCGRTGASEGISGAGYTASYTYDALDRITTAAVLDGSGVPLLGVAQGSYAYDTTIAPTHLHGLSHVGTSGATSYGADYDAAGHQPCRSVGSLSCASFTGPTGQQLGYDALGRLLTWQNASSSPTATGAYAYDGAGERVWQQDTATSGPTTTTTTVSYILGDEITSTAVTGQTTTTIASRYYPLPGGVPAVRDASGLSYVGSDLLGTPIATFNLDTGTVTGLQLRAPLWPAALCRHRRDGGECIRRLASPASARMCRHRAAAASSTSTR